VLIRIGPVELKLLGQCIPNEVSYGQVVRVATQYIDARPARLHENFKGLAIEAMQAT
jgi:hypothetical protein